jgi:hypothetical protein
MKTPERFFSHLQHFLLAKALAAVHKSRANMAILPKDLLAAGGQPPAAFLCLVAVEPFGAAPACLGIRR